METGQQDVARMTPDSLPPSMYPWHLVWCAVVRPVLCGDRWQEAGALARCQDLGLPIQGKM